MDVIIQEGKRMKNLTLGSISVYGASRGGRTAKETGRNISGRQCNTGLEMCIKIPETWV